MDSSLLIAQVGRSGGVWLTQALSHDERWQVEHEFYGLASSRVPTEEIRRRFEGERYCEITHLQNEIAWSLECRKAVVLRHPREVFESYAARNEDSKRRFLHRVDGMYAGISDMLEEGAPIIHFDLMVKSPDYCAETFEMLGFEIDWKEVDFTPKNQRKVKVPMPAAWEGLLHRNAMQVWETWS
ncbi:MAG: hypothetical protein GY906_23585 [bacterium]|nr:hypothetical protein [bacterium]